MDCNRENALKAKQLAEKKMEDKDFSGALKIAAIAQRMYPELENISQMILVCEVHCCAETNSYGTEKDWYGILKIDPSADDLAIKKQYRKLALVLHPDKNKFSGSTDAFKLIGEAQRVLLDREKRIIHDSKRRAFRNITSRNGIPKQPTRQSNVVPHPWNQSSFPQGHPLNSQFQNSFPFSQTGFDENRNRNFWTICLHCSVRYQYPRHDVLNKVVICPTCKRTFTAMEINFPGSTPTPTPTPTPIPTPTPTSTQTRQPSFPQQVKVPSSKPVFGGVNSQRKEQVNVNKKRKKKVEESSESSEGESSSESEEDVEKFQDFQNSGEAPRRSSRAKRNVSYKENVNDNDNDDDAVPSNQAKETAESSHPVEPKVEKDGTKMSEESDKESVEETETDTDSEPEVFECPDPEFYDFEKDRKEESFLAGQTWAVYDTEDAMPRFYAYIRKVESPDFHLLITWLKFIPENNVDEKWLDAELPVSCGNYKRGKHDKVLDLPMFSHKVFETPPQKGASLFTIFPRKGETWALFQNWSINWYSTEADSRSFEYEFVEILSDYDKGTGVRVSLLEKVKGFTSLYKSREGGETVIAASEKNRFSHMVPCRRMSGDEREGVPEGCYELDPASLPSSAFEEVL